MPNFIDLSGKKFGRLFVLCRSNDIIQPSGGRKTMWRCRCECGTEKDVWSHSLISGMTKSCGCLQREITSEKNATHGMSGTRLGRIWRAMKTRCYNPNFSEYEIYGGRGIEICDEWLNDPCEFFNWALRSGYSDDLSIDRIDTNKGYSPDNCRWVTSSTQNNNKRSNINITYDGETHTMAEWACIKGIQYQTLKDRIGRYGWSIDEALSRPVRINSRNRSRYC